MTNLISRDSIPVAMRKIPLIIDCLTAKSYCWKLTELTH